MFIFLYMSVHGVSFLCISQSTRFHFYEYDIPRDFIFMCMVVLEISFYVHGIPRDFFSMHMRGHEISFFMYM